MPLLSVTPDWKEMPSAVLVILPPNLFNPAAFCVNWLPTVRLAPTAVVNRPELVTSIVEPTVLAPTPLMLSTVPLKSKAPVRVKRLANVVATVPTACV